MHRATAVTSTVLILITLTLTSQCRQTPAAEESQMAFAQLLAEIEPEIAALTKEVALTNYEASISGNEEDYSRAAASQLALKKRYADSDIFHRLQQWHEAGTITDPLLQRQLEVLYLSFLGNQLPEQTLTDLVNRQSAIEQRFNTYRATVDGTTLSDNELAAVLRSSTDSAELEKVWAASKEIGAAVSDQIIELVKLRNEAAQRLGFSNFQAMQLALSEQDPASIEALFDELDALTRDEFARVKGEIDQFLARRLQLSPEQLRPWHYQDRFFQEAPAISSVDLDSYYADQDLVDLTARFYAGIGLPVADLIAKSDLYERPGKYQHAFCEDIDRAGDVRVLCSVKPNRYWMDTLLHELGHAVYAAYNDPQVPWLLRDAAHSFTTEAIANLFGRCAANPFWMQDMLGISDTERDQIRPAAAAALRAQQLVFSRWSQVMFRFEKAMYENPDQDLNARWWDLVERYQLLTRPEDRDQPDWAAKIHVALYPAYYHNYLMGELLASQLTHSLATEVLQVAPDQVYQQSFVNQPEVGRYLQERVFKPGRTLPWNEMIEAATGEPLTATYYAQQFVGSGPDQEPADR